ncbi:aspartic peptidase domain-containing protein [Lactifluus subvellereus]|nr:aspartic peptidase domain-containing protein [Lactifluus subvellereus]
MYLPMALVVAALHFVVEATLFQVTSRAASGLSIPMSKRSALCDAAIIDIAKLQAAVRLCAVSRSAAFDVFERNHPTPRNVELWHSVITVGTPAQTYTGVTGDKLYNPSQSSTWQDAHNTGEQYTDAVVLAGYTATRQRLGAATTYSAGFQTSRFPADGVPGIGYQSISEYNSPPVFQRPCFPRPGVSASFWVLPSKVPSSMSVGRIAISALTSAIIDTGTTQIIGDTHTVQAISIRIPGAADAGSGIWTSTPLATSTPQSPSVCQESVHHYPSTFNHGFRIVGDVFLQNVYTVLGNSQVGVASNHMDATCREEAQPKSLRCAGLEFDGWAAYCTG